MIFFIGINFFPSDEQPTAFVSGFGFSALLSLIFILTLPILVRKFRNKVTVNLLINRRILGIMTFTLVLGHVSLIMNNFYGWDFGELLKKLDIYTVPIIAFTILLLMTLTSNDWSVKKLGKNWKRLHSLVYIALILVLIHSFTIGKIIMPNAFVKAIIFLLVFAIFAIKFRKREPA